MSPDVIVVGAGPAGMAAALALDSAGAKVRVVDEQNAPGGQVYRSVDRVARERPENLEMLGPEYARGREITGSFADSGVEVSFATGVWDISIQNGSLSVGLVGGVRAEMVYPKHIILATGAMERPTPFPGWTLPGVMTVGAAQTLFKESALLPDSRPIIAGSGPLVYQFTRQMLLAGVKPAVILDTGPTYVQPSSWKHLLRALAADAKTLMKGVAWLNEIRRAGIKRISGVESIRARGNERLESVAYRRAGNTVELESELLLVHDGVIPNCHLAMAADCEHRWNPLQQYWQPVLDGDGTSSRPGISIAGDGAGIRGVDAALCTGRIVGWNVSRMLGFADESRCISETRYDRILLKKIAAVREFLDCHYKPFDYFQRPPDSETIVCRCEQVTVADIREVAAMGCMGPNQGKAFTRCGMGPCMGRQCGNTVSQLFAKYHDKDVDQIGHYRIRSPVKPLTVGQLSNLELRRSL